MKKLINEIDKIVKKLPALPANIKTILVQIAPWAAIITVVMSLQSLLLLFGVSSYFGAFGLGRFAYANWGFTYTFMVAFLIGNLVLRGLSIPGLFAKSIKGWNLFFYSVLLYFVYSIFHFDVVGGSISTAISLYFAFQIKDSYK